MESFASGHIFSRRFWGGDGKPAFYGGYSIYFGTQTKIIYRYNVELTLFNQQKRGI
jgi:hypothetical protein